MTRPVLEVADIFRGHGAAWRAVNRGHVSLDQLKVMSAIERCRTAALGGHVARCEDCAHTAIAYNSCLMGKFLVKRPFGGPKAVLAYLSRYTHRVAISNRRLILINANSVTFKVKDYRVDGPARYTTMTLATGEFIRRFLLHVLPSGFHRIRHYGLFASSKRAATIAQVRELLGVPSGVAAPAADPASAGDQTDAADPAAEPATTLDQPCPCCGGPMITIETFKAGCEPRHKPAPTFAAIRIDTS